MKICACICVYMCGRQVCVQMHMNMYVSACRRQGMMLADFIDHSPPYILGQGISLEPIIAQFESNNWLFPLFIS